MNAKELPLRAELFGPDQLENHAKLLASKQEIDPRPGPERLLHRLRHNEQVIRESYHAIAEDVREGRHITPAAEWLLDNAYLIENQIDIAREYLPPGYSRELPRLAAGEFKGYPRIYELAFELVSHTDGRIETGNLTLFLKAYQAVLPLRLGELWAIPIMLRLALLENLRRVAYRIALRRRDRKEAMEWSKRFLDVVHKQPKALIIELADLVRANPPISQAFIAELATSLHGHHPALVLVINWIEQELSEMGQTIEQILQSESHEQAANGVSVGNSITSLRMLTTLVWEDFVESSSITEHELRQDPAGIYSKMDFRTRDRYRHVVERLAKYSRRNEQEVAALAVQLAGDYRLKEDTCQKSHVGYFLMGNGLPELERALNYKPHLFQRLWRHLSRRPFVVYVPAIVYVTAVLAVTLLLQACEILTLGWGWLLFAGIFLLIFTSQSAISIVNWLATILVPERGMPRLDLSKGIPDEHRTVVVIPTMLTSMRAVNDLIETIEIHYLANRSSNLFFALLTDFVDAPGETMPDDDRLIKKAADEIRNLNTRYAETNQTTFFLLHRPRLWNPGERIWMGYERKRGKLQEFNRLIRKGVTDGFSLTVGDIPLLGSVKYVITLDTDTHLPPETAWKMIGTMAHPLNRPNINPSTGCVAEGYGVLQPRVAISLAGASRSRFARLFSGEVGIDPYTREVSNVYHDIFARSQFIGKGIYDLEAFSRAVGNRFPENRILSHDLIEGAYARCGFINDVELIEDHPSRYLSDVNRRHRWTRGDWQVAPWCLSYVPGPDGKSVHNTLEPLFRWMLFDNLRRSLTLPALLILLGTGWLTLRNSALVWTVGLLTLYLAPNFLRAISSYILKPKNVFWSSHLSRTTVNEGRHLTIEILKIVFLPYETLSNVDAIFRVLWRTMISHRRLLKWQTSRDVEKNTKVGLGLTFLKMWISPFIATAGTVSLLIFNNSALNSALPFIVIWFAGPILAWFISKPLKLRKARFTLSQTIFLRRLARRTWMYFEHFIGLERNWLPPDNFQEQPQVKIAERTSPTNIGLGLLSTLGVYDFGYISTGTLIDRTEKTFTTLEKMQRYRGHFFNWYDVQTLLPLSPLYISTVDSGNLSACLITLKGGLLELASGNIIPSRWRQGIEDTVSILAEEVEKNPGRTHDPGFQKILDTVSDQAHRFSQVSHGFQSVKAALSELSSSISQLEAFPAYENEVKFWLTALRRQVEDFQTDLIFLLPWLSN
ncbi:MAG: cyclic beta 1-2 glucan synthetase, partial [Candidatus Omnitrophica bacterium]|nr:cyclic beta 1-2 glucan synthetase [Candidatus Omnitrophota bacterium]